MQFKPRFKRLAKLQVFLQTSTVLLLLSSCGNATLPVNVPEEDFYTDAGDNGAIITHYYDKSVTYIGLDAWKAIREGMTCEKSQTFADWKAILEKLCSEVTCTQPQLVQLRAFLERRVK